MNYREIVEAGGAVFVRVTDGSVFFIDPRDGAGLSLYVFALGGVEDVRLALKANREPVVGFQPLVPTEEAPTR